jgi:RHS repeat-associated protein
MMPAAKHGDPQLGVDIHMCVVPPSPSPVPLPTPHMSIVFDPFDYVPILGATVTVCGMKRATAGTNATVVHIPPGFPFAPKLPDKDDELFMGSATVVADGDPMSHISHPVLGCQVAGMISPPRLKKKNKGMMLLPTTFNLAIPSTVFVGGPPTISLMGMAFKGAFAALGKFAKSGLFKRIRQKLFGNLKPGFLKCKILRAEPVNILTGEVSVEHEDFTLPGRIPIEWTRSYSSSNRREGLAGHGWETLADARLEVDPSDGTVVMRHPTVGPLFFARLPATQGEPGLELEVMDGALLSDWGHEYRVRTKEDRAYCFAKERPRASSEGIREFPISRIEDLCGNSLQFERRGGRLIGINESAGRRIEITNDSGRISEVALLIPDNGARHVFVRYEYDAQGDLVAVRDALSNPYTFAYDAHRIVRHTDRNGLSFYYEYEKKAESDWRVRHAWGDGGLYDYGFEYLDALSERRITDSLGHVSIVKLDERGLPISEIDPLGGMTIFEYDEAGRTTAVVDPGGRRTGYEYDERGNLLKLTRPDSKSIQTEFNAASKAIKITDPNGAVWQQQWNVRGLLVEQTTPLGNVSRYEYDSPGQLVAFTNPRGTRTELFFDGMGNLTIHKDALGHETRFAYDPLGNVTGEFEPLDRRTLYRYDAKSRLADVRLPSGATISYTYDAEDNLIRYVDENGQETRLEYCGLGEIAKRLQPDGHSIEYHYDTEERLIGVTNQRGEIYHLDRDPLDRIVQEVDYWGQARRYSYDASGYLKSSADPLGRTIQYETDPLGRILKKTLPDGLVENFVYDANGNVIETKSLHGICKREFDAEGRLVKEVQSFFTIKNAYDANGNRVARETSLGNSVAYEFDALDQAVSVRINQNEPMRIERDAAGRIAYERLSSHLLRRFRYSANGYPTEQAVWINESPLFATRFEYDPAGNLTQRNDSKSGTDVYRYDPVGRITEHLDPQRRFTHYVNDPAGDRLRTRIVEGSRQRVVGGGVVEEAWSREGEYDGTYYRFDRAGNLVERRDGQRDLQLVWDANQRLIESHTNGTLTRYGYDPLGRRLFKETGDRLTQFCWDGDALVGESLVAFDQLRKPVSTIEGNVVAFTERQKKTPPPTPRVVREYVYYPDTFEPLALVEGTGGAQRVYHYHNDPNGCPTRLTNAEGDVKWAASFAAWGQISRVHFDAVDNPIRLQGQYEDIESGLYYNRYRYYETSAGHFLSQDPLGLLPSENPYRFAPNIFGWSDPFGLSCRSARRRAVKKAWKEERALVQRTGVGTRAWTKAEKKELLAAGKVKGYEGHHINNVATHPHLAGNPDNIKFVKGRSEHLKEHGGNFQNPTSGPLLTR